MISRDRFAELLYGPLRRGMRCDIDMKALTAGLFKNHKHIKHAECRGNRPAEVTREDAFGMIVEKWGPALRLPAFAWAAYAVAWHVCAHRSR